MNNIRINFKGFTLAEVLITLIVIGIVAALVIPIIIQDMQDANFKIAYKKAYSTACQSWNKALSDGLIQTRANWNDDTSNNNNFNAFMSEFSIVKVCDNNNNSNCWVSNDKLWGGPSNEAHAFIDSSGMAWSQECFALGCGGSIFVDTNGSKGPNIFGKDRFPFFPVPAGQNWASPWVGGFPIKLVTPNDQITPDTMECPYGNCYFASWLKQ